MQRKTHSKEFACLAGGQEISKDSPLRKLNPVWKKRLFWEEKVDSTAQQCKGNKVPFYHFREQPHKDITTKRSSTKVASSWKDLSMPQNSGSLETRNSSTVFYTILLCGTNFIGELWNRRWHTWVLTIQAQNHLSSIKDSRCLAFDYSPQDEGGSQVNSKR